MSMNRGRFVPLNAVALAIVILVSAQTASAQSEKLIAAAKSEGQLTVIALARNWCGYGPILDAFKTFFFRS